MCDPGTALAVGSMIMSHQQASQQAKMQTAIHRANQQNALRAMESEQYDLGTREMQEQEAAAQQIHERNQTALEHAASLNAQMEGTGVGGNTMAALMREVFSSSGRDTGTLKTNQKWASQNFSNQKVGTWNTANARGLQTAPGVRPSLLATGLKIGATAAPAIQNHMRSRNAGTSAGG